MAALTKQNFRMRLLEVARADFGRGDLSCNRKNRYTVAVAVEQPVNQVQVTRSAGTGTHRQLARQMCFGTSRECSGLLVAHMHPIDLALSAQRISDAVQAVTNYTVNPSHAHCSECLANLICYGSTHDFPPVRLPGRWLFVWTVRAGR